MQQVRGRLLKKRKFVTICLGSKIQQVNGTFNNISAISWQSVLLVEETGVLGENHQPVANH
jgi:hypothetical protein